MKSEMPFLEHVKELRKYLLISLYCFLGTTILAYVFYEQIVLFLSHPFANLENKISLDDSNLFINSLLEGFFIKIKISLIFGFIVSFPIHLYHVVRFILPALKPKEKKVIFSFISASFILIIASVLFSYQKIIPISIDFLSGVGFIPQNVGLLLSYQNNILFVLQFLIASLFLFQLPIVLNILLLLDIVKRESIMKQSRIVVLSIFFLSAIITPPDPVSLVSFAIPLVLLFYFSLLIAKIFNWGN